MKKRKKPEGSFVERAKFDIEHETEIAIRMAYEVGLIRGRKDTIDKACEWLNAQLYTDDGGNLTSEWYQNLCEFIERFRKAMEE